MSLPRVLNFANGAQTKASAVAAVSSNYALGVISGQSFSPSSTMSFDISAPRCSWLDTSGSYLEFDVTVVSNVDGTAQFSGPDFIKTLSTYSQAGAVALESVSDFSALHWLLRDLCSHHGNSQAADTITYLIDPTRGRVPATLAVTTAGSTYRFAMPLISIFGSLTAGSTFLPLWALNSPCRMDLGLNSAAAALTLVATAASATYTITNPKLNLTLVSISEIAQNQIQSMCNNQFLFHNTVWRTCKSIHPAAQMTDTVTIPIRADSLKSVLTIQRPTAHLENITRHSNLERLRNNCESYQFRIGSSFANPKPVTVSGSGVEGFQEARRVFGNVTSESNPTLITLKDWIANDANAPAATRTAGTADHGSFCIALEAEPFSQSKGALIGGSSTLSSSVYLDLVYTTGSTVQAVDVTSFTECDALFSIDGNLGTFSVKF